MRIFLVSLALVFIQCSTPEKTQNSGQLPALNDLLGDWSLVSVEFVADKQSLDKYRESEAQNFDQEWLAPVYVDENDILRPSDPDRYLSASNRDLHISADSMFWFDYPLQLQMSTAFSLEGKRLKFKNEVREISLSEDKQTLTISYLDYYGLYLVETWKKTQFKQDVLAVLKRYKTNFPELAGTWMLIRESSDEYGNEYRLDFPYTIADTLVLSREELVSALHTDRSVQVLTNGRKYKYFLRYEDDELHLVPDSWYDHESWREQGYSGDFYVRFERRIR